MKKLFVAVILIFVAFNSYAADSKLSEISHDSGYFVSPEIGQTSGVKYYIIKKDGEWKASRTGDLTDENVERFLVDVDKKMITLYVNVFSQFRKPEGGWTCVRGEFGATRKSESKNFNYPDGYSICSTAFTKSLGINGSSALLIFTGSVKKSYDLDQEAILKVAQSSGLIEWQSLTRKHSLKPLLNRSKKLMMLV